MSCGEFTFILNLFCIVFVIKDLLIGFIVRKYVIILTVYLSINKGV